MQFKGSLSDGVGATKSIRTLHKSLLLNTICAFNKQIIVIINLLPKQLVINYNLMINYLVLTAWGNAAIKH